MVLQLLVPQYNETDETIKPLLDSITIQQGVELSDVGVIIVNDGSDTKLSRDFLDSYPYEIQYLQKDHEGVSAARQYALDRSTADYVMFCDADDMFFNVSGLYILFREIKDLGGFDILISAFTEQILDKNTNKFLFVNHETDSTFVHGKCMRRKFLTNNNIKWNSNLTIHEDSYFNCLCQRLANPDNSKYCPMPFYLWRWRDDSVCRHDPKYILKTYNNMLDSNTALIEEFVDRRRLPDAQFFAVTMIFDAYFTMNKDEWLNQDNQEYRHATELRFKDYYETFEDLFNSCDEKIKNQILVGLRNRFYQEGMMLESITFKDWIESIKNM